MKVVKASGKKEEFNEEKIRGTLQRAGASKKIANEIISEVKSKSYDGISTKKILDMTLRLLDKKKPEASARYDLKRGIMSLGPTGFIFEKFFAKILEKHGYKTEVGQMIKGKITTHEIDIVAEKDKKYMIECKYHNASGVYTNLKVAMYTHARFLDLRKKFDQGWIATNTKLSSKARKYANGVNIKITSWNYPKGKSLSELIEKKRLYPVTILKSANKNILWKLANADIFFAHDFLDINIDELRKKTKLNRKILEKLAQEAGAVCDKK